jgi:hypothetical protein
VDELGGVGFGVQGAEAASRARIRRRGGGGVVQGAEAASRARIWRRGGGGRV